MRDQIVQVTQLTILEVRQAHPGLTLNFNQKKRATLSDGS